MNSISDVWQSVLSRLQEQLSETTIRTWFDEVDVVTMEDSAFVLHCSNSFKKSTIETRFMKHIKAALKDIFSSDLEVKILNDEQLAAAGPLLRLGIALFDCLDTYTCEQGSTRMNLRALRLLYELSLNEAHSMSMHVLSKLLCIQRQQLSRLVTDMEYIGFAKRNREKRDAYAIFVDLTPAGLAYVQAGGCRLAAKLAETSPEQLAAALDACALLEPLFDPDCMTDRPRKPVFRPVR